MSVPGPPIPLPQVIAFDAYGTLLDVHSAVARLAPAMGPEAPAVSALWRAKQLEYTWVRSLAGRYRDFWRLTEEALAFALAAHPGVDPRLAPDLMQAYRRLSAYPDAGDALIRLRRQGVQLCVLTNGAPAMIAEALNAAGLTDLLDAVLSVDALQVYKTAPAAYRLICDRFGVAPDRALLVSSNRWDIAGARAFGLQAVWVNRSGAPDEYPDLAPTAVVSSLADL